MQGLGRLEDELVGARSEYRAMLGKIKVRPQVKAAEQGILEARIDIGQLSGGWPRVLSEGVQEEAIPY